MIDKLLDLIAPHLCFSCQSTGSVLCDDCKNNITSREFTGCLICGDNAARHGICGRCCPPYTRAWCVGERADVLQRLVGAYKFERLYDAHRALAGLLTARIGPLPADVVVVPIPTIASHIRQRGYDHMLLVAKHLAQLQGLHAAPLLERITSTVQVGSSRAERQAQAARAFRVRRRCEGGRYLVIDDVITTGASLEHATRALMSAGAAEVWVAAIARQSV